MELEESILDGIRRGDRRAMRQLYDSCAARAIAVSHRYVGDADARKDIVQESFIQALTHIDDFQYRGKGSLIAWLLRIVVNLSIDYVRKHERWVLTDSMPETPDEDEPPVEQLPPEAITEMLGRLPAGYRMVFNLYVFEQRSHKEIAQLLHIKENSSASQFFRAKKMMARMMKEYIKTQEK